MYNIKLWSGLSHKESLLLLQECSMCRLWGWIAEHVFRHRLACLPQYSVRLKGLQAPYQGLPCDGHHTESVSLHLVMYKYLESRLVENDKFTAMICFINLFIVCLLVLVVFWSCQGLLQECATAISGYQERVFENNHIRYGMHLQL